MNDKSSGKKNSMRDFLVILTIFIVIQQWGSISDFFFPPPVYSFSDDNKVVLYSTTWCGYCAKTRKFLNYNNVAFKEFDVEKSEQGIKQYNQLGGGGVPILNINDHIIRGYDEDKMISLLDKQIVPKPPR
jgi:mycoredoxin